MNKTLCALTLMNAAIPGIPTAAGDPISSRSYQEESVGFGAGALAGAIIAGPADMLVGAGGELHAVYRSGDREGYPFDRRVMVRFRLVGER